MKSILVAVAGSTPQIITESLYDLWIQRNITISSIIIITTKHGEDKCNRELLNPMEGYFYKFCEEYDILPHEIKISMLLIKDNKGNPLQDIRSEEDNRSAASFISSTIAKLCDDQENTVLASIAGGRKTMSVYLAYAMQMYARKQDRLFHVLVEPQELEFSKEFYFPSRDKSKPVRIKANDGKIFEIQTNQIKITNAEIPFIRLRDHTSLMSGKHELTYEDLVALSQNAMDREFIPNITPDLNNGIVHVNWRDKKWSIKLQPIDLAFYRYILGKIKIINSNDNPHTENLKKIYSDIRPGSGSPPEFTHEDLIDSRTRINKELKNRIILEPVYKYLLINTRQVKRVPSYWIEMPKIFIFLE